MGSLSSNNKNVKYLLCVIDVFTKYAQVKPLKDKKGNKLFNQINCGLTKEENFTINLCKNGQRLDNNDILMYLTHNKGKLVIAERFLKTLKTKIYKKMTANGSKSYLSYLNKIVDEYNNTYHHSIIY